MPGAPLDGIAREDQRRQGQDRCNEYCRQRLSHFFPLPVVVVTRTSVAAFGYAGNAHVTGSKLTLPTTKVKSESV